MTYFFPPLSYTTLDGGGVGMVKLGSTVALKSAAAILTGGSSCITCSPPEIEIGIGRFFIGSKRSLPHDGGA